MFSAISRLLGLGMTKVWLFVGGVAAAVAIYWRGGTAAKQAERERQEARRLAEMAEAQQRHIDDLRKLQEKRDEVADMSDDDVSRRLRDKWTRPEDR